MMPADAICRSLTAIDGGSTPAAAPLCDCRPSLLSRHFPREYARTASTRRAATKLGAGVDEGKRRYEPPKVLRLTSQSHAIGTCDTGSGDAWDCIGNGNSAGDDCIETGNSAYACAVSGNSPDNYGPV